MLNNIIKKIKSSFKKFSVVKTVVFLVFAAYALLLLVPYIFGFLVSLKTDEEYYSQLITALPNSFNLKNYVRAWTDLGSAENGLSVPTMLLNSLWYSVGTCVFSLLFSSMCAYVVSKYDFKAKGFIYGFAIVTMIIPIMGALPSQLKFAIMVGSYNSPLYAILNAPVLGTTFVVLYSVFKGVSWEYAEAAFIDGAGHFTVFFTIMLPQVLSPLCALFLTNFIWLWADSETPMIFFDELPPIALGLYRYKQVVDSNDPNGSIPTFYAGLLLCMIPSLTLFAIFQNTLMDIQMGGGLKG